MMVTRSCAGTVRGRNSISRSASSIRSVFRRVLIGQAAVPECAALDHRHDVEGRADDRRIFAQRVGPRHGKAGRVQSGDQPMFALHGVRRWEDRPERLAAQHVAVARGIDPVGRVGLAAGELGERRGAREALHMAFEPRLEPRHFDIGLGHLLHPPLPFIDPP
jgi:hypothetical protein